MNNLKKISITKLTIGSYVEKVSKQLSKVKIIKTGWVRDNKAIAELKREGVIEVIIDTSRQREDKNKPGKPKEKLELRKLKASFEQELVKAKKLQKRLTETLCNTQERVLENIPIDILALEKMAEAILKSVSSHPHCLACLIRVNTNTNNLTDHNIRVAVMLAQHMVFQKINFIESIPVVLAGLVHDLGKLLLPIKLQKHSSLLTEQLNKKRSQYVKLTMKILQISGGAPHLTLKLCYQQMELLNGSGYPNNLDVSTLPKISKLFSIIDELDSLLSGFEGNKPKNITSAYQYLMTQSPEFFDPDLLQAVIKSNGVYIAGSLVKLKTGKIGYVKEFKLDTATSPIVHCFFNAHFNHHIEATDIDLSGEFILDAIETAINKSDYKLQLERYI